MTSNPGVINPGGALAARDVLRRDHYIIREGTRLRFRLSFLRRYWCRERMLPEPS